MKKTKNEIVKFGLLKALTYVASSGTVAFIGGNVAINGEELISLENIYALVAGLLILFVPKLLEILQNVIPSKTDSAVNEIITRAMGALQEEFKSDVDKIREEQQQIINMLLEEKEIRDNLLNTKS